MNQKRILICFAVMLLVLGLAGCSNQPTLPLEPTATAHAYPPPMNDPHQVATSLASTPEEEEVAAPTEAPETEPPETEPTEAVAAEPRVDNCVECHTDQQMLIDTADPVEEVVSENEGEG